MLQVVGSGMLKGLSVTLLNFVRPSATVQYPDKRVGLLGAARAAGTNPLALFFKSPRVAIKALAGMHVVAVRNPQSSRFRGNEFVWYEERCTGCASCAKYCPMGIIEIVTSPGGIDAQEGESYALDVFDIDIGRCMFCGLCVEACPYDALHMGTRFERAKRSRIDLVISKEELNLSSKHPSSWFRPQIDARDINPFQPDSTENHYDVGRHEQPSDEGLKDRWVDKR